MAVLGGCGSAHWAANGFLDPTQVGQFNESKRNEIRTTLSILEEPPGIQNAEEPTAEDLEPWREITKIRPGDALSISIYELQTPGMASVQQLRVGNSGFETLPTLGPVEVVGLTPRELELALKERLREAEILLDADVQVSLVESRSAQCSVVGSVSRPGVYALAHSEVRLLDMIAIAGGIPPMTQQVYVIRKVQSDEEPASAVDQGVRRTSGTSGVFGRGPFTMSEMSSGSARASRWQPEPTPAPPPPTSDEATEEPEDEFAVPPDGPQPKWDAENERWVVEEGAAPPASRPAEPVPAPEGPGVAEDAAQPEPSPATAPPESSPEPPPELPLEPPMEEPAEELLPPTRILEIPVKELMEGDPRYNVVLRPFDLINVPIGNVGEFYLMGNVARPGAYTLTGRRLTVKEAIASAGGFGPLAWPSRADLVRRVSDDEEQIIQLDLDAIFAGEAPDFYLRPSDVVNVGTTVPAYFFAVLRNSFRFTYGAGFVYDRNFGDSDTFVAREQLKQRRTAERAAKGLPF